MGHATIGPSSRYRIGGRAVRRPQPSRPAPVLLTQRRKMLLQPNRPLRCRRLRDPPTPTPTLSATARVASGRKGQPRKKRKFRLRSRQMSVRTSRAVRDGRAGPEIAVRVDVQDSDYRETLSTGRRASGFSDRQPKAAVVENGAGSFPPHLAG